jgi:hypothetical protein
MPFLVLNPLPQWHVKLSSCSVSFCLLPSLSIVSLDVSMYSNIFFAALVTGLIVGVHVLVVSAWSCLVGLSSSPPPSRETLGVLLCWFFCSCTRGATLRQLYSGLLAQHTPIPVFPDHQLSFQPSPDYSQLSSSLSWKSLQLQVVKFV